MGKVHVVFDSEINNSLSKSIKFHNGHYFQTHFNKKWKRNRASQNDYEKTIQNLVHKFEDSKLPTAFITQKSAVCVCSIHSNKNNMTGAFLPFNIEINCIS